MQFLTNLPNFIDQWLRYRFQTLLVVCFLLWTPFLVTETLQVQHSCHPMIHWSGTLPDECQAKLAQTDSRPSKKAQPLRDRSQEQNQIAQRDRSLSPKPSSTSQEQKQIAKGTQSSSSKPSSTPQPQISDESPSPQQAEKPNPIEDFMKTAKDHSDITGGVIAIGVAGTVAAVASVPLILAAGIGAVVWFAIRAVL